MIIAGCCRNVGQRFPPKVLENIEQIGNHLSESDYYCISFVTSDSTDNTPQLLDDFIKTHKGEIIRMGNLSDTIPLRTARLAACRNAMMDRVRSLSGGYEYLLIMDMDDIGSYLVDIEGVKSNFAVPDWTVITASNPDFYYDIWALRWPGLIDYDCWEAFGKDYNMHQHLTVPRHEACRPLDHPPIEIKSGFNGAAIYKIDSIHPCCRYIGLNSQGHETCEHVSFHECIRNHGGKVYINPRFVINYPRSLFNC